MLAGIIGTVAGRFLRFMAIQRLGAAIASPLNNLNPLVSTALAILLLGEQVTLPILAGTVVIVTGATLLSMGGRQVGFRAGIWCCRSCRRSASASWRSCERWPWPTSARSPAPPSTSRPALVLFTRVPDRLRATAAALACDGRSFAYFVGAGLTENLSVFLTVVALGLGTVSVVTPLTSTSPIFVLLLSPLLLRGRGAGDRTDRRRHRPDRARRLPDHRARPLSATRQAPREDRPALVVAPSAADLEIAGRVSFAAEAEAADQTDRRPIARLDVGFETVKAHAAGRRR